MSRQRIANINMSVWPLPVCVVVCVAALLAGGLAHAAESAGTPAEWKSRIAQLAKPAADEIVLTAAGDAIWNRKISGSTDPRLQSIFDVTRSSDIAFLNFEQVLADSGYPTPKEISKADPSLISEFTWAGVNLVSIANNHMMDFGRSGLETTLKTLDANTIKRAGAGMTLADALKPGVIEKKGLKVALLAFLVAPNLPDLGTPAGDNAPGVAPIRGARIRQLGGTAAFAPWDDDLKSMEAAIKEAKKTADVVAVRMHMHWGPLEEVDATGRQLIARAAIDAGADILLGHGPHVVNPIEFYKGKPILYSMGNFVFQFNFTQYAFFPAFEKVIKPLMANPHVFDAVMVRMILSPKGPFRRMELLPIGLTPEGDPHFVTGAPADEVLNRVKTMSEPYGTVLKREGWYAVVDMPKAIP